MILFFADRLATALTDINQAYEVVARHRAEAGGEVYHGPHNTPSTERFRIVTNPEHLRGYRDYTYIVLPSAARNPDLLEMVETAKVSGATEESYPYEK